MNMNPPKFSYSLSDLRLNLEDHSDNGEFSDGMKRNKTFDSILTTLWESAQNKGLFRYQIKNLPSKVLPGKYNFVLQLNPDRAQKRRKPQEIKSLQQPFNSDEFNFNKVKPEEILLHLKPWHCNINFQTDVDGNVVNGNSCEDENVLLINVSPLEFGHILLVPYRGKNQPQRVSLDGIKLAVELALLSQSSDFRVGFNSLCGYASVNHEHYHAYYLKQRLYLEYAEIIKIKGSCYEIADYPGSGFVFVLSSKEEDVLSNFISNIIKLTSHLQNNDVAHNIFITRGSTLAKTKHFDCIRVFVWARKSSFGAKGCDAFNPALCELGGHFPCKHETAYDTLTEDFITKELGDICQEDYMKIRSVIEELL